MTDNTEAATLNQVVLPLVEFLNHCYPSDMDDYYVGPCGQYGQAEEPFNEVSIDLNIIPETPLQTKRALMTLLRKSGSNQMWTGHDADDALAGEHDFYKAPLRFAIVRRYFHLETHLHWLTYLVVDHRGDDFDVEAAERQIALLVGYLEDPLNLDELRQEELAAF